MLNRRHLLLSAAAAPLAAAVAPRNPLEPVPLGRSGLSVTPLSLGIEEARDAATLRHAADSGVNHFFGYSNYQLAGEALRSHRHRVVLSAGSRSTEPAAFRADLEKTLRELGVPTLDLWFFASCQSPAQLSDELLSAVLRARRDGLIRAAGATTHRLKLILPRVLESELLSVLMVAANFTVWNQRWTLIGEQTEPDERPALIARARSAGIGIVAMKPMLGGLKFRPPERKSWIESLDTDEKRRPVLAAALRWAVSNPALDCALVSTPSLDILQSNLAALRESSADDARLLAAALPALSPHYCRMCHRCDGACPQGLPVAHLQRLLLYAESYGQPERARALHSALPAELRQPHCSSCSACHVRCPNGVRVRDRLIQASEVLA